MRAQIAVEFLVILSILAIVSLLILNVIKLTDTSNIVNENRLDAMGIADNVALQINTVYLSGNGAQTSVSLPETLSGNKTYNLSLNPNGHLVGIFWNNDSYTVPIITENASILSNDKNFVIKNYDGKIIIT